MYRHYTKDAKDMHAIMEHNGSGQALSGQVVGRTDVKPHMTTPVTLDLIGSCWALLDGDAGWTGIETGMIDIQGSLGLAEPYWMGK